jgi:WD40 repeat protein
MFTKQRGIKQTYNTAHMILFQKIADKKNLSRFIAITLLFILFTYEPLHAQIIFRTNKPDIKHLWSRVADFSPTLRSVEAAEISPDGKYVISGSKFGYYLMLWRVADGYLMWEHVMDAEIEAVTFSSDGQFVAAGDEAYTVNVFDLEGKPVKKLDHDAAFDGITWSPNGKYLAGGSEKGEVVLWNTRTWNKTLILEAGNTVNSLQFTKDTRKLIAAGNKLNNPGSGSRE